MTHSDMTHSDGQDEAAPDHDATVQDATVQDVPHPSGILARVGVGMLRAYQLVVSPWFAPRCRYYPSCSQYAVVALGRHGAVRGSGLAVWRVLRCNPWSLGGVDHVPEHPRLARTLIDSLPANSTRPSHDGADRDLT